ncbi:parallel beta-helix domain-containing protein [Leadbetterella byssophila]|jgi:parallel beta-helix repeat protein|uniref:Parallel beta-helix repeat protein n=2 Tax=Leadbetterella TaxID=319458 RepID=E4RTU5_LEAB4|nr:parallel beta-helix repeat protein [Leadbetterella byssophila DSM 17132]
MRILVLCLLTLFTACKKKPTVLDVSQLPVASEEQIEKLMEQFIDAKDGSTITIPEGFFELPGQLILDKVNNVTVKGAGMFQTVLSFKTMKTGGEGMKISGNHIILEDFTVTDAPGDNLKTQNCEGITFRRVNATWTHGKKSENGTYGIYPVQCKNVLVEYCEVSHSRDAGIYVGQSENIIVRNNYVHQNVAGIEIENSDNAEVYDNHAENNTGGILIFNLPGLPKAFGSKTRVFNNLIKDNNHENFAIFQDGNPVSMIPPGSGVIVLAGDQVEIFNNKIIDHKTLGIAIASYHITDLPIPTHPGWTPFTSSISIHDNTYERPVALPDLSKDWGKLIAAKCLKAPDILYDGILDESKGKDHSTNPMQIFIDEKVEDLRFFRMVIPEDGNVMGIKMDKNVDLFKGKKEMKTDASWL